MPAPEATPNEANSLWRSGSRAFFKDQRAAMVGDIVTVLVNMNDNANLKNVTSAARNSAETGGMPNFFGMEALLPKNIVDPAKMLSVSSANNNTGNPMRKYVGDTKVRMWAPTNEPAKAIRLPAAKGRQAICTWRW